MAGKENQSHFSTGQLVAKLAQRCTDFSRSQIFAFDDFKAKPTQLRGDIFGIVGGIGELRIVLKPGITDDEGDPVVILRELRALPIRFTLRRFCRTTLQHQHRRQQQ
ncbi:MAG: hypothetical protein M3O41_14080 [Pseudomonadota bacterium]|nr:hypothetical protein [Pseudomonadota bacterium]